MKFSNFFSKLFGTGAGNIAELLPDVIGAITTGSDTAFADLFKKLFKMSKQHQPLIHDLLYSGIDALNTFIAEKVNERGNPLILNIKRVEGKLVFFIYDVKTENGKTFIDKTPVYVITDELLVQNALAIHEASTDFQEFAQHFPKVLDPHYDPQSQVA